MSNLSTKRILRGYFVDIQSLHMSNLSTKRILNRFFQLICSTFIYLSRYPLLVHFSINILNVQKLLFAVTEGIKKQMKCSSRQYRKIPHNRMKQTVMGEDIFFIMGFK